MFVGKALAEGGREGGREGGTDRQTDRQTDALIFGSAPRTGFVSSIPISSSNLQRHWMRVLFRKIFLSWIRWMFPELLTNCRFEANTVSCKCNCLSPQRGGGVDPGMVEAGQASAGIDLFTNLVTQKLGVAQRSSNLIANIN